ncbi:MAG: hypothetical protein AB7G17_02445 [Phycisphaerales bacterium]
MDQRQTKIVEGAGLEESRLNTDFIDWLKKWGSPILFAIAVIAGAYAGWQWWQRAQAKAFDEAHLEWQAAATSASPDNLLRVARDHPGRGAVPILATLDAADIYLMAGIRGIVPAGKPDNPADALSPEDVTKQFELARDLYSQALSLSSSKPAYAIHTFSAKFGLAAALESLGQHDDAKRLYDEIIAAAPGAGFPGFAEQAKTQSDWLERAKTLPPLATRDAIKASARPVDESPTTPLGTPSEFESLLNQPVPADQGPLPQDPTAPSNPEPTTPEPEPSTPPAPPQ